MTFKKFLYLLMKYYLITGCQTMILTDVSETTTNVPDITTETALPTDRVNKSENIDNKKMLQIEFNEIRDTIKNDLRKSIIDGKSKRSTTAEDAKSIVKKLDENSKSLLKALLKIQNDTRPVRPMPHKLKSFFITTLRPKNLGPSKVTKNASNASHPGNHKKQSVTVKTNSIESAVKKFVKEKEQVPPIHQTANKHALRLRVKARRPMPSLDAHLEPAPQMPNAEILDMAPAKGARVHLMRTKGRLCHRHVLLPEGPKYDHEGRAYLDAHRAWVDRIGRPFEQTHAPRLLLPSCCNCCKKSVLGCE